MANSNWPGFKTSLGRKIRLARAAFGNRALLALLLTVSLFSARGQDAKPAQAPATPAASATDLAGIWQGALHVGERDLRTELKITKTDGAYKTTFYSIDQGGQPLVANKTTFDSGNVAFTLDAVGGKFEGKMSPDAKTITGTWTQGPNPIPLVLERTTEDAAWPIPAPPKQMAPDANPGFEVVTIKPGTPGSRGKGFGMRGTHFTTLNTNLNDLIAFAYGLHTKQIVNAPDWFGTDLWNLDGIPDVEGRPSLHQMEEMVQKLLPDRFGLKFHYEQRELQVYIVSVAPGGPKMTKTTAGPNDQQGFGFRGLGDLIVRNMNMKEFASWMQSGVMDRPVVDHTGLTDKYDFTLKWTPDDSQFAQFRGVANVTPPPGAGDNPNAPPSLYTAMPEQLGLKMEAGKAMDDVIVIDHIDKPSPN